jgi:hypothetical protein
MQRREADFDLRDPKCHRRPKELKMAGFALVKGVETAAAPIWSCGSLRSYGGTKSTQPKISEVARR